MKKIILVDDEPMMLKIANRALKDLYEIRTAVSGAEALSLFSDDTPDLIISDLKMPGMSGYELLDAVREKGSLVPFIFMTADDGGGEADDDKKKGAADYIKKPVRAEIIKASVEKVLQGGTATENGAPAANDEKLKLPEWLLHEPLIDIDAGLAGSGTAEDYLSFMKIFLDHVDANIHALEGFLLAGDFENYTIKAHGLKSTSRVIGAMVLSTMAYAMERAGMDKNTDFIKSEHEGFIALYKKVQKVLTSHDDNAQKEALPEEDIKDAFMALKEYALAEDYAMMENAVNELLSYALPPDKEKIVKDIKAALLKLEWDAIREML